MSGSEGGALLPVHRLALALDLQDFMSGRRPQHPVSLQLEEPIDEAPAPDRPRRGGSVPLRTQQVQADRHGPGLFVVRHSQRLAPYLIAQIGDPERRFVARRLKVPIPRGPETALAERVRRPVLLPGAAYPLTQSTTGIRGQVVDADGSMVPHCRVQALLPSGRGAIGWAHGDDRGEFLLVLGPRAAGLAGHVDIRLQIAIHRRVLHEEARSAHPFVEELVPRAGRPELVLSGARRELAFTDVGADAYQPDPVEAGISLTGFSLALTEEMNLRPGRLQTRSFRIA